MDAERIYGASVRVLSIVIAGLGLAMIVAALLAGGGPLSAGVVIGLAFAAVGAGRLYIAIRGRR